MPAPELRTDAGRPKTDRDGNLLPMRSESRTMTNDQCNASRIERLERERLGKLSEAREQMAAALLVLDDHSRSPAAATLDLALHHLDGEIAG